jgi:hypothetical protein
MMRGYDGLNTLKRAAFLRPVQIVRQTISNLDTAICPYHRYEGLSIGRKIRGNRKGYTISLWLYTNLISWHMGGYVDMLV